MDDRHDTVFPAGFFSRTDETDDGEFYAFDRLVTHIDDGAIAAVSALYDELGLAGPSSGPVLDICSSLISHFSAKPERLTVTGMNAAELAAHGMGGERLGPRRHGEPTPPFGGATGEGGTRRWWLLITG